MNTRHEHVKIDGEAKIISFPEGIPGFRNDKEFQIYHGQTDPVSYRLQSCDCEDLSFTLMAPESYDLYYDLTLSEKEEALLEANTEDDLAVFLMLAKGDEAESKGLRANVHGPVIINIDKQKGIQKVLEKNEPVML